MSTVHSSAPEDEKDIAALWKDEAVSDGGNLAELFYQVGWQNSSFRAVILAKQGFLQLGNNLVEKPLLKRMSAAQGVSIPKGTFLRAVQCPDVGSAGR